MSLRGVAHDNDIHCYISLYRQSQLLLELLINVFTKGSLDGVQLPDTEEPFAPLEVGWSHFNVTSE